MLTAICDTDVSTKNASSPQGRRRNAVRLSDVEISRRVLAIRSGWSLAERVRRRRAADERFLDLMVALTAGDAA
ncbi:hypothetical protein Pla52o_25900 [Novipirellula galeiformis]|uniref:Uncharacterized protein n=1 Tax=Novipirellula galeiformis TaxID=2528004 RepID=A0A5C6CIN5_9BACT|nr:hypothetical protein [Novipirellula galeiformis]TWU23056.1 hypothetical protein Pla52o_25900 [Novipirellula galeiformis]